MKIPWRNIWEKCKAPPTWVKIVTVVLAVISAVGSLCMLAVDFTQGAIAIVAYTLFGIAGVSLAYSVYLLIPIIPTLKARLIAFMEKRDFTYQLLRNFGFRTVVFAIFSFAMSLLFSAFNAYMGIVNRSIWYGALATYYIALAFLRGGILVYHKNKRSKKADSSDEYTKARIYRNSGIIMLILNIALSSAIAQMIFAGEHFTYIGWTIFAYSAYAFYKITMSIINFVRAHKQTDLTVSAIRNINLADALVAILALQTALLTTFSDGTMNISLMNTLTGTLVSLCTVGIAIYMLVFATKRMKKIKKENTKNEQSI
ncbi:MAG: hypothetical protein IKL76_02885 [Clostridia bacterium]|nr:hypothetical protein [Clostridia bacterium]